MFICILFTICILIYFLEVSGARLDWPEPPPGWIHSTIAPQYTVNNIVVGFGAIFVIGIIFFSFDIRARDVQNKFSEVIDSKPANNLEVTAGRMAGILLLILIPMMIFLGGITCYEVLAHFLDIPARYGLLTVASTWGYLY